jgi:hypothetical protein
MVYMLIASAETGGTSRGNSSASASASASAAATAAVASAAARAASDGVAASTLTRWTQTATVRVRGDRYHREYLLRDVAFAFALQLVAARRVREHARAPALTSLVRDPDKQSGKRTRRPRAGG